MDYKLKASSQSQRDTEKIIQFYTEIKLSLARDFLNELKATSRYIQKNPKKIQIRYSDVRVAFLKRFPVGVHFKISILGTSEDPKKWDILA